MRKIKFDYLRGGELKDTYAQEDVVLVSCPLCEEKNYDEIYKERGVLGIVKCLSCGLIYVNPRLKEPDKVYWGDQRKYFEEARLIFEGKARHHRDPNYLRDLKTIYKYKPSGNLLDIGTNMGFFLRNAHGWRWNLYGVEPSPSLSEMARDYFNLNVKTAFLEEAGFNGSFFDVITMIDVFEHLPNPGKILIEIQRIMKSDGILFIKVPNGLFNLFKYHCARMMKGLRNLDIFDSYEHVVHYSQKTLQMMLKKYGFKTLKTHIGKPIQVPVWHHYVGHYFQYPSPWLLDYKTQSARTILYFLSLIEHKFRFNRIGYLGPNIITVAQKDI